MLKGIATSSGIAIGKVFKYIQPDIKIEETKGNINESLNIFDNALIKTEEDICELKKHANHKLSDNELAIFEAHLMMLKDPEYIGQIKNMINQGYSAAWSTKVVSDQMIVAVGSLDNQYLKERAVDIKDVSYRLLCNILNIPLPDLSSINEKVIVVADELAHSDVASLNKDFVLGICSENGGVSSHAVIIASSMGIPTVISVSGILDNTNDNDTIIVDAIKGEVIIKPNDEEITYYQNKNDEYLKEKEALNFLINQKAITKDGRTIHISSNINDCKETLVAKKYGVDGIGLYRTEFLFIDNQEELPSEEKQFEAYKEVLANFKDKRVVARTLDIGGDKGLECLNLKKEDNPFLGYRAIRLCLGNKDLFKTQIRALLRASIYGKLSIIFPMIATLDEFIEAKEFVLKTKDELIKEGFEVSENIEIGMMIETPAAAIIADQFAKYADFFSIGTNDLIQYTMAADRLLEEVSYLYQPLNPSILRLIKMTVDGAHKYNKWCCVCGEMGSDEKAIPLLVGLGVDELSMTSSKTLIIKKIINNLSYEETKSLAIKALECQTSEEVKQIIK